MSWSSQNESLVTSCVWYVCSSSENNKRYFPNLGVPVFHSSSPPFPAHCYATVSTVPAGTVRCGYVRPRGFKRSTNHKQLTCKAFPLSCIITSGELQAYWSVQGKRRFTKQEKGVPYDWLRLREIEKGQRHTDTRSTYQTLRAWTEYWRNLWMPLL